MKDKFIWNPGYPALSPIFDSLGNINQLFTQLDHWPTLDDYQSIFNKSKLSIKPVEQSHSIECFEEQYEQRIYLQKELQTRLENWHDYFNALVWLRFPETKKMLNKLHYQQSLTRTIGTNRSTLENRITQFDECGAIIISDDNNLLDLIRNHQWKELFIENRTAFTNHINCIVFGHAIFEKALTPYTGMTCHCILVNNAELLEYSNKQGMHNLDQHIANIWSNKLQNKPDKLAPYPILGTPGYWPLQDEEYYCNRSYFR